MKCRQCGQEAICEWHLGLFGPSLPFCSRACMNQYQQEHELSAPPSLLHRLVAVLDRLHLPERLVVLDGDHSSKPAFCTVCGRSFPVDEQDYYITTWHDPSCTVLDLEDLIVEAKLEQAYKQGLVVSPARSKP